MSADQPLGDGMLNLPYEAAAPGSELDLSEALVAGGLVVMAATLPLEGHPSRVAPALVFRFVLADGTFMPPVVFAASRDEFRGLLPLFTSAIKAALRGTFPKG